MSSGHILSTIEGALVDLRNNALMMARLTERNVENARKGIFEMDEDWCNTVIADDEEIDTLEVQVDRDGIDFMLRFHPVASDMRNVVATMKFSVNLERVADQAVNIARRGRKLITRALLPEVAELGPIYQYSSQMLRDSIQAFADNDIELSRGLRERDRDLDQMTRDYADKITELMPQNPDSIPSYMDLIFISRFLERIGDQAKNIGEDTVYAIAAEEIRHIRRA